MAAVPLCLTPTGQSWFLPALPLLHPWFKQGLDPHELVPSSCKLTVTVFFCFADTDFYMFMWIFLDTISAVSICSYLFYLVSIYFVILNVFFPRNINDFTEI